MTGAIIAHRYEYVVGVDTHARTHTFTVIETRTSAVVDTAVFPSAGAGIARAISWIRRRSSGRVLVAVEGTSLPASSGNTTRHRLNRGGDRQLNRAFDIIVRTRMSFGPDTRDYVDCSRARGKTNREIRRTLKRYVCRAVFRHVHAIMT